MGWLEYQRDNQLTTLLVAIVRDVKEEDADKGGGHNDTIEVEREPEKEPSHHELRRLCHRW